MKPGRTKVILHIGQHKTGSKALQSFLARHAASLLSRGILYPMEKEDDTGHGIKAYSNSHYRLFSLLCAEAMQESGDPARATRFREEQAPFCRPFDSVESLLQSWKQECAISGAGTLLLSAEDIFDMHTAHENGFSFQRVEAATRNLARLFDALQLDPVIVVYLRRQDHLLGAHYIQFIKGSATHDIDFESFSTGFAPRLCAARILEPWISTFGVDRIRIRPYEIQALPRGITADFFEYILGFSKPVEWEAPEADVESQNISPSRNYVEFIRLLNRRHRSGLPVFAREDVLDAAFREKDEGRRHKGIAEWMSPRARCMLLETHADGNRRIADLFFPSERKTLFCEPLPDIDSLWQLYSGLSVEREAAIENQVRESEKQRKAGQTFKNPPSRPGLKQMLKDLFKGRASRCW